MEVACFECGNTSQFRQDCQFYLRKLRNIKNIGNVVKMAKWKSGRYERWGNSKNTGKGKKSGADVRFAEIEGDIPGNAAISTDQTETVSDENEADVSDQ